MKTSLIILALFVAGYAFAVNKKPDMHQGNKALDKKNLESLNTGTSLEKNIPQSNYAQDKTQQLESKRSRQYQEERPVKKQ